MDKRFVESCLAQDVSLEAIGEVAGKHRSAGGYWLKRYGSTAAGSARHAPKGGVTRAELEPLVEEGLTIEGIAQRLGVGDTKGRRWLAAQHQATQRGRPRTAVTELRK